MAVIKKCHKVISLENFCFCGVENFVWNKVFCSPALSIDGIDQNASFYKLGKASSKEDIFAKNIQLRKG